VLECFRRGEFDYVDGVSEVGETEFFCYIGAKKILGKLAETYPSPREKEEVPLWMYVASNLSMRLHGFVEAVGRGVMKLLILDRGFLDGEQIGRCKQEHGIDIVKLRPDCSCIAQLDALPKEKPHDVPRARSEAYQSPTAKALDLDASMPCERNV
jgi:hypothetical protein